MSEYDIRVFNLTSMWLEAPVWSPVIMVLVKVTDIVLYFLIAVDDHMVILVMGAIRLVLDLWRQGGRPQVVVLTCHCHGGPNHLLRPLSILEKAFLCAERPYSWRVSVRQSCDLQAFFIMFILWHFFEVEGPV